MSMYVYMYNAGTRAQECSKNDIAVTQGKLGGQSNGIPIFEVQITNTCAKGCPIADIHLSCGEFTSATLINPMIFRRLAINDCLVNNGAPLSPGVITHVFGLNFSFNYLIIILCDHHLIPHSPNRTQTHHIPS